jgi:hypothetical protein
MIMVIVLEQGKIRLDSALEKRQVVILNCTAQHHVANSSWNVHELISNSKEQPSASSAASRPAYTWVRITAIRASVTENY